MSSASAAPRVVVRAPNWLGDAVLALPAIAAIRRHYADADLTVAASPSVSAVFREVTAAAPDHVLELPAGKRDVTAALVGAGFDVGILFPNSFRSAWQFYRSGIRERWGFATAGRGLLLTRRSRRPDKGAAVHHADYYRALVRGLDIACEDGELPRLLPSAPSLRRADALLRQYGCPGDAPVVALLPGAAYGEAKQWPADRMAELAGRLIAERGVSVVLAGASHDRPAARAIESWLRAHAPDSAARVVDLVGRTSLGALAGVLGRSVACVSNDSGGMHLASALGKPVVAIFGPTDERATRPAGAHELVTADVFCRPCMLRDCPIDHRCMKRITVERVFEAVAAHLPSAGAVS